MSLRDKEIHAKREGDTTNGKLTKAASTSSSRQWSAFKNPRIVRVSRTFGGKDRHSKVCTIRGLRDRRIRLSVPTAIQLYDLQDRLGLNQPSKVIDWLLDVTKLDIDKLPPLQIPPGSFAQFHQPTLESHHVPHQSSLTPFLDANLAIMNDGMANSLLSSKEGININHDIEKEVEGDQMKWNRTSEEEEDDEHYQGGGVGVGVGVGGNNAQVSAQNFFPINANNAFLSGLLANNPLPYNYYHWDPIALSQFGGLGLPTQADQDTHNNNNNNSVPLIPSSSLAIPSGSQLFFCPSVATSSLFPPYANTQVENDFRQLNRFHQISNSQSPNFHTITSAVKYFPCSTNPELQSHENNDGQPNKDDNAS
ncbi:hypothetical protein Ancab_036046 [Ancistrocladus abbreviatus]